MSLRASVSFSISETGVSRSATSRVQTTWFRPAPNAAENSSIAGKSCMSAGHARGPAVVLRGPHHWNRASVDSISAWFTVTPACPRSAAV